MNRTMPDSLSFWEQDSFFSRADLLVVGSGLTGLQTAAAVKLQRPHWRISVVDGGALPAGASTRNAGFACFGSLSELLDDLQHSSEDEVLQLVERRWKGLLRLRKTLGDQAIRYQEFGGYELFRKEDQAVWEACLARIDDFNQALQDITAQQNVYQKASERVAEFGFSGISHLILNRLEGQVHTGHLMKSLLDYTRQLGVQVFSGLEIQHLEERETEVQLHTAQGWKLSARQVLLATNGFASRLVPGLAVEPARNQVLITEPLPGHRLRGCFHYDRGYYYFRDVGDRILLGGGRNLDLQGEATDLFGHTDTIQHGLRTLLETVIAPGQQPVIASWWSGIMGMGPEKKPILHRHSERVLLAVRLGGMGVALSSLLAEEAGEKLIANS
jgi:gamma-glutamylputrescine oxidase